MGYTCLLSREPDFVLFGPWHGSEAPQYFGEVQLAALPGFKKGYRPVRFRAEEESALVWVRVRSKRIGLTMGSGEVVAPAWLFGRPGPAVVTELSGGRARTRMAKGSRSGVWVPVSTGTWRVEVRAQEPAVIELLGGSAIDEHTVSVSQPTTLKVVVRARGGVVWLDSVRLVRLR